MVGLHPVGKAVTIRLWIGALRARFAKGLVALVGLVVLAVALGGMANGSAAADLGYKLGSGDKLRITVFGEEDLSGEFQVDGGGYVSLPLIGQIKIGGENIPNAEAKIKGLLQGSFLVNPRVSVSVLNYRPFFILGEVKEPGQYEFVNGMTVLNAIALAGGYTYRARTTEIVVIRASDPKREERQVNEEEPVFPGDILRVPERFF